MFPSEVTMWGGIFFFPPQEAKWRQMILKGISNEKKLNLLIIVKKKNQKNVSIYQKFNELTIS